MRVVSVLRLPNRPGVTRTPIYREQVLNQETLVERWLKKLRQMAG